MRVRRSARAVKRVPAGLSPSDSLVTSEVVLRYGRGRCRSPRAVFPHGRSPPSSPLRLGALTVLGEGALLPALQRHAPRLAPARLDHPRGVPAPAPPATG